MENHQLKAPLRIDFAGGWIDVPEFSRIAPGHVVNVAISPHIQATDCACGVNFEPYLPSGGIASSTGAIVIDALKLITRHAFDGKVHCTPAELGELIYSWENSFLNFKIGRQDQYAITLGGINCLRFGKDQFHSSEFDIETHISEMSPELRDVEESLILVHTGITRKAQGLVLTIRRNIFSRKEKYVNALKDIARCGTRAVRAFQKRAYYMLPEILNDNWAAQKKLAPEVTNKQIDKLYKKIMENGAIGGKLCGCGGGGYFVFICRDREKVMRAAKEIGVQVIIPKFEMQDILKLNNIHQV